MTRFVLKLPNWLLFLMIVGGAILSQVVPYGAMLGVAPYVIWLYSLWDQSNKRIPSCVHMSNTRLLGAVLFASTYMLVAGSFSSAILPYIIPFHFFAMYCLFYVLYFIAKSLRSVELDREARFEDWFAVFIGLWFSPIGIWFVQKKAQKIFLAIDQK